MLIVTVYISIYSKHINKIKMRLFLKCGVSIFYFLPFCLGHCYNYRVSHFISRVLQPFSITCSFLYLKKAQLKEELQGLHCKSEQLQRNSARQLASLNDTQHIRCVSLSERNHR